MKINIKARDLADLAALQKALDNKLKKPLNALLSKQVDQLPFCYEAGFFPDGGGFVCIGESKEIQNIWKKQRVKGQYKKPDGTIEKVDKKKVAYGIVQLNDEGVVEFVVQGGMMKRAQAKIVIKSIALLKKKIGDNFVILSKAPETEVPLDTLESGEQAPIEQQKGQDTPTPSQEGLKAKRKKLVIRQAKRKKMTEGVEKLQAATGVAEAKKVRAGINKYKGVLKELVKEAEADGTIDPKEQKEIGDLKKTIERLEGQLDRLGDRKIKLTPKRRAKVKENINTIDTKLQDFLEKLGI